MLSMIAEDMINQMIPPLKVTDSAGKAAKWLDEFHVGQLPVIENRRYRGLITEADILDVDSTEKLLANIPFGFADVHVQRDQHFYNIIEMAVQNKVQLIPVLDDRHDYMGVVSVSDTLAAFGETPVAVGLGGIIVLTMDERDYSLSQISRYVEENNAKVLSAHVARDENEPYKIRLTLKLNTPELASIVATLERFGYTISAQFSGSSELGEDEQDRYDALLKYLSL
jgi:CBS domain-containing protein